ncbi:MAG: flagellar hook capping FlgD N-terminal domain-containing protein [Bryobacteraceae bacterium]|jgi:flagellar basal-body rod modification protein FlgD
MQVQDTTTTPSSTAATSAATNSATSAALSASGLGDESTFLQLLVTQIQNQDPTSPMDSTTFLTQLASFSQLEQLIGIRQDTDTLSAADTAAGTSTTGTNSTTNTTNS